MRRINGVDWPILFKSTPDCRAMVVYTNYIVYENMINFKIIVIDNKPFTHINETIL